MSFLTIDKKLCTKDGLCVQDCPMKIINFATDGYPEIKPENSESCIKCGHCLAICPNAALTIKGKNSGTCPPVSKDKLSWETIEAMVKSRRSIRRYKSEIIPAETLDKLLNVTRWAPTGGNSQFVKWLVIENPEALKKIIGFIAEWARANEDFKFLAAAWDKGEDMILRGAPQLAIAYAGDSYGSAPNDCVIAATTLELAASTQGIGACWAGFFMVACGYKYQPLLDFLALPAGHKVCAALMLGYPRSKYTHIPPRPPADIKRI